MVLPASIRTRNELRYYKQGGRMPDLRVGWFAYANTLRSSPINRDSKLERRVEHLTGGETPPLQENRWIFNG